MQKSKSILSHAYLREILHYSVITGQFYWLKPRKGVKSDDVAGTLQDDCYKRIKIDHKIYRAHRLAWFWVTGEWPANMIDHKNGIKDANCWLNLREATRSQNNCNTSVYSNNASGYKGITWCKDSKKWQARIMLSRKPKHLGYFEYIEAAYAARLKAEKQLHGDFARKLG